MPEPLVLDLSVSAAVLTRQLCDVDSVSGNEAPLADAIEHSLRDYGHLEVTRNGNAIVARTALGRRQRAVIAGHIDTVPINDNLPTRVDDGVIWGRGTVDMKAGCAVQLVLAAELTEPAIDLTWVWYDNEEVDSTRNGLGRLARENPELLAGDFAVLMEPTSAEVEGGCNGTLRAHVTTRGRRAHSARAWLGVNAIHAAAPVLGLLEKYEPNEQEVDGLIYRESLNAVRISGGVAGNVIPDLCQVEVNYRFAPNSTASEASDYIRLLFDDFDVEIVDAVDGARPGMDAPLAQRFVHAVGGTVGPKYGWTDVARFSALGIPAVNYGPGDPSLAHADDERVPIEHIERCENGLRAWLSAS